MMFNNAIERPIDQIAVAFAKAQPALQPIQKKMTGFNCKYADLYDVIEVVLPIISKYGLVLFSLVNNAESITVILLHTSGQYISSTAPLKPASDDQQDFGSAMTYKRRYLALGLLGIHPKDEDDDGSRKNRRQNQTQSNYDSKKQITQQQLNISKDKIDSLNAQLMGFTEDIKREVLKELKINNFSELKNQDYTNALNIIIKTIDTYDGE